MTGGIWGATARAEVGPQLAALGAHYGACRTLPDGTRAVSWWFEASRRRQRRLVFRAPAGRTDEWEVEYAEHSADGRRTWLHDSRTVRTTREGLAGAVADLVGRGLTRRGAVRELHDDPTRRPVVDGPSPGPRPAAAAASAHRPPPPPRGLRVADGVLGMVVAAALFAACRIDIDLAPNLAAVAVPLFGVSAVWTLIGVTGAERR
ncbi:hypothetical protein [Actinomycetospora atypica]|uniref:Uncharacterized protein n=1 Tax=Actinomycetospora atypica TaxID=1290095 RepID=A0ABV9YH56_9PSEU